MRAPGYLAPLANPVPAVRRPLGIDDRAGDPRGVALTFDDGPHPQGTPAVLEVLRAAGVRATFFLVGEQVERDPALAAEIAAAGHEVGVHGHRHRTLLLRTAHAAHDDLDRAAALIAEAAGRAPRLHRPPRGLYSAAALRDVRRRGWRPLLWTRWGRDWQARATPASIAARATRDLRGGEVILLHDADHYGTTGSWRRTTAALPAILDAIAAAGLRPVTP